MAAEEIRGMVLHRVGQATHLLTGVVTDAKPNKCVSEGEDSLQVIEE
jgi:hypothetical protein